MEMVHTAYYGIMNWNTLSSLQGLNSQITDRDLGKRIEHFQYITKHMFQYTLDTGLFILKLQILDLLSTDMYSLEQLRFIDSQPYEHYQL